MAPKTPLPLSDEWESPESYVESLLSFVTGSEMFRTLCGGVHILDFFVREPDSYSTIIPEDWRDFFCQHQMSDILDLLLRDDITQFLNANEDTAEKGLDDETAKDGLSWRGGPIPPKGLLEYIHSIRRHALLREFKPKFDKRKDTRKGTIPHYATIGMKPKKCHEVENFSRYVASLTEDVDVIRAADSHEKISHIVDFGSGQNYLGRALASSPYNRRIIAIERRQNDIVKAKQMDVSAKLAKKTIVYRNKKEKRDEKKDDSPDELKNVPQTEAQVATIIQVLGGSSPEQARATPGKDKTGLSTGSLDYVEHEIQDGYLEPIINHIINLPAANSQRHVESQLPVNENPSNIPDTTATAPSRVMVVSLHSCGNLVHHGIQSLIMNPSVVAIAMIGCCYNLMTERLGPATYKLPSLRLPNTRLEQTSNACDPHGFPMSKRLESYIHAQEQGIRLNITARMMAVQAPYNWGPDDSEAFFTRHFYRALLQRILIDYGVLSASESQPLIVGSLRKSAFISFSAYVWAAVSKLVHDPQYGELVKERVSGISDSELEGYTTRYGPAKKNLSIVWSLMGFSASVVEAIIVVDRWLFLREQDEVRDAWVEPVFEYSQSPRNLVVVGVKK
ncbi:hypothetical protein FQN57_000649 [Myotisia sp. PD_48]|nr:hypothetical protein FQN57_000649 [Myotisia sp. PD_48]